MTLIFIVFITLIFNMYIKRTCIIGIFINLLIHFYHLFCVLILEFIIFSRLVVFFSLSINTLHVSCLFFPNSNDYNLSSGSVYFRVHTDIDKNGDCLQNNNNDSLNDLWLLFESLCFLFESLV